MFTAIDQHDEPLAALVNNAGILFTQCTVENLTAERINRVLHQRDGIFSLLPRGGKTHGA